MTHKTRYVPQHIRRLHKAQCCFRSCETRLSSAEVCGIFPERPSAGCLEWGQRFHKELAVSRSAECAGRSGWLCLPTCQESLSRRRQSTHSSFVDLFGGWLVQTRIARYRLPDHRSLRRQQDVQSVRSHREPQAEFVPKRRWLPLPHTADDDLCWHACVLRLPCHEHWRRGKLGAPSLRDQDYRRQHQSCQSAALTLCAGLDLLRTVQSL